MPISAETASQIGEVFRYLCCVGPMIAIGFVGVGGFVLSTQIQDMRDGYFDSGY